MSIKNSTNMEKRNTISRSISYCGGSNILALKVGCSTQAIYRWLTRKRNYSPASAKALSKAVDGLITPEAFLLDLLKFPRIKKD